MSVNVSEFDEAIAKLNYARIAIEENDALAARVAELERERDSLGSDRDQWRMRADTAEAKLSELLQSAPNGLSAILRELAEEGLSFHVVIESMDNGNFYVQYGVNADSFESLNDAFTWVEGRAVEDNPSSAFAARRRAKEKANAWDPIKAAIDDAPVPWSINEQNELVDARGESIVQFDPTSDLIPQLIVAAVNAVPAHARRADARDP